jgi:hypothetical protein
MKPPAPGKQWRRTPVDFILKKDQRKEVLQWMKMLMFLDGHAMSLSRGVNLSTIRVLGMKSHDYHIWNERLLPAMTWGYVPELCAKELSQEVIYDLEKVAPVLLCKLERIFPPGFFLAMQHLILHLPYKA